MTDMSNDKQRLVQLVAREVLSTLRSRGMVSGSQQQQSVSPAPIRPPVGTCTGDYSKFIELRDTFGADPNGLVAAQRIDNELSGEPIPLAGIITASQLQQAMETSPGGVAVIAADARLTPLANDLARQDPQKWRRISPGSDGKASSSSSSQPLPWLWWIAGHCPNVDQVTGQRTARMRPSSVGRQPNLMGHVVREIAAALKAGQIAGAVLFVDNAALATCFANRCASIRAVVGTCGEAVEQGVSELGANVLVVEYPHVGPRAMGAMVDRMLQEPPKTPAKVQRELADLHRC